ncbi:MAG: VCBS repeat-containing protein [Myxococcales bacterium]|nr:VCBS repeat-containing protein [Myxococcales bacterium]
MALALLTACTSLPAFDEGTCGNLVLDPGESCDEASEICDAQCRLLCGDLDPGASCGGGFVCGIDGVCQAPGGSFGEVTARLPLDPVALTVTDLDSDHIGDLLAVSATTISVTFGDVGGVLHDQTQTIAPVFRGAPAFGHLDGDGRADVLLATPDGIVGYSSAHGVIAPHPFALDLGQTTPASCAVGQPFAVFSIDEQFLGVLYLAPNGTDLGLAAIDSAGRTSCPTQRKSLCTVPPGSNPLTFPTDLYDTSAGGVSSRVVAITTPTGACIANLVRTPLAPEPFAMASQDVPGFAGRPVLADLVGNGCPSLIQSTSGGPALVEHLASGAPGACAVAVAGTPLSLALTSGTFPFDATAVGHVRLDPPLPGYRRDAVAMTSGVYAVATSRTQGAELYRSDRTITFVEAADLDGDGDLDLAALGEGVEGIDALYRTPSAGGTTFLRVRVPTRGIVTQFAVGDFDGNLADDVVYTERAPLGDRLSITYGTGDRLLDPIEVGAFSRVVGLCPLQATDSSDPQHVVADLVIIDLPVLTEPPLFTLLHGSPQRTMVSFYDPRFRAFDAAPNTAFSGVAFTALSDAFPDRDDVLAIETTPAAKMWPIPNLSTGLTFPQDSTPVSTVRDCSASSADANVFCTGGARYVSWPRSGPAMVDVGDVVIGVAETGPDRVVTIDPSRFAAGPATVSSSVLDLEAEGLVVRSLHAVDFVGDTLARKLVVSFGPRDPGTAGGHVEVCDVDGRGVPTACKDLAKATSLGDGWVCVDAVPARIAPRGPLDPAPSDPENVGTELIAVCHDGTEGGLYRVLGTADEVYSERLVVDAATSNALANVTHLAVGDVTGDGIDDVLATYATQADQTRYVLVIPQCVASDLKCRGISP